MLLKRSLAALFGAMPKETKKKKNKGGRPRSKYKPEYCEQILDFFSGPAYEEKEVTKIGKGGDVTEGVVQLVANPPLFLKDFAQHIGIHYRSVYPWIAKYPEFKEAYEAAKKLVHERIITNALMGLYNNRFSIFTMKNLAGWRDIKATELSGRDGGAIPIDATALQDEERGALKELAKIWVTKKRRESKA
jgi:hypothetical protein